MAGEEAEGDSIAMLPSEQGAVWSWGVLPVRAVAETCTIIMEHEPNKRSAPRKHS